MRYNVTVHQSGLYLLGIVLEPSLDPSSNPLEEGNTLRAMLTADIVQVTKRDKSKRLKIEGLGPYGTLYSLNPTSYSPSKSP